MSGTAAAAELYSVIEKSAQLLDIACSHGRVWPILTTYADALVHSSPLAFRVATGLRHVGDLDCRFVTHPKDRDPYPVALSHGLISATDHPVGALLSDIKTRCPIDGYGIDFGVVGGFKKVYAGFAPDDLQELSKLADLPSMPPSLTANFPFFARHGLADKVAFIAIDYPYRTVNVYFNEVPAQCFAPRTVRAMLGQLGLPEPSERMLRLGQDAFGLYVTLNWNNAQVERFCFGVTSTDLAALPVPLEPAIEHFAKSVPFAGGSRKFVYGVAASRDGEYYKLESHYKWTPGTVAFI
jgi:6-linalyl-2-O,3-dimethylflaviolin/7-geranyloxy-5-hydroxy-2-methoxy-3-methylnaphthalene-1,4-dione synthase